MITEKHAAERLSRAYVQAIAAGAGLNIAVTDLDYGVDGTFHDVRVCNGRHFQSGYPLDFQLKASKGWTIDNGHVVYDIEAKTFNDLERRRKSPGSTPFILMLLCLPDSPSEWCAFTEEQLLMKRCCYWFVPDETFTENTSTIRIRIPRDHLVTPEVIREIMDGIPEGNTP